MLSRQRVYCRCSFWEQTVLAPTALVSLCHFFVSFTLLCAYVQMKGASLEVENINEGKHAPPCWANTCLPASFSYSRHARKHTHGLASVLAQTSSVIFLHTEALYLLLLSLSLSLSPSLTQKHFFRPWRLPQKLKKDPLSHLLWKKEKGRDMGRNANLNSVIMMDNLRGMFCIWKAFPLCRELKYAHMQQV